jgi:hypothetical protein
MDHRKGCKVRRAEDNDTTRLQEERTRRIEPMNNTLSSVY